MEATDSATAARLAVTLESIVLRPLLAPLAQGGDTFGEYGAGILADAIAGHDAGFAALLAAQLERR